MVYEIYTHLNSLDHVSPKKYHMTASSMEQQVDLTGVVVFSSTTWIWIWEFGSGRRSGKLFLGICPNIFLLGGGGQQEIRLHNAYPRCSRWCCCKNTHPYKSSNNKIPSKRPPFLRPELAEWDPTVLLCTTTGFKKRHLLRCNNVEVESQVLGVSNLSKTWYKHPVLSRVPWKNFQAVFRWNKNNQQETCVFLMIMFHV